MTLSNFSLKKVKLSAIRQAGASGERQYSSYAFLTSALRSASRSGNALLRERTPVPIGKEDGWATAPVWTKRRRKIRLPLSGFLVEPRKKVYHYPTRSLKSDLCPYKIIHESYMGVRDIDTMRRRNVFNYVLRSAGVSIHQIKICTASMTTI